MTAYSDKKCILGCRKTVKKNQNIHTVTLYIRTNKFGINTFISVNTHVHI